MTGSSSANDVDVRTKTFLEFGLFVTRYEAIRDNQTQWVHTPPNPHTLVTIVIACRHCDTLSHRASFSCMGASDQGYIYFYVWVQRIRYKHIKYAHTCENRSRITDTCIVYIVCVQECASHTSDVSLLGLQ